jgi:hypothetical protein
MLLVKKQYPHRSSKGQEPQVQSAISTLYLAQSSCKKKLGVSGGGGGVGGVL